jgi:hypothetical protein
MYLGGLRRRRRVLELGPRTHARAAARRYRSCASRRPALIDGGSRHWAAAGRLGSALFCCVLCTVYFRGSSWVGLGWVGLGYVGYGLLRYGFRTAMGMGCWWCGLTLGWDLHGRRG